MDKWLKRTELVRAENNLIAGLIYWLLRAESSVVRFQMIVSST